MPNWTFNEIHVNKGNLDLRKYVTKVKDAFDSSILHDRFDFNLIVPEPKTMEECIEKYGDKYIDHGTANLQHTETDEWFHWYRWHCDFWGTKWNACDTYIDMDGDGKDVSFSTAWSEPEPIWKALSEQNPECEFRTFSEYEEGIITESTWRNGKRIKYSEYERTVSEDADYEYDE